MTGAVAYLCIGDHAQVHGLEAYLKENFQLHLRTTPASLHCLEARRHDDLHNTFALQPSVYAECSLSYDAAVSSFLKSHNFQKTGTLYLPPPFSDVHVLIPVGDPDINVCSLSIF
jgi:hypothetical protein